VTLNIPFNHACLMGRELEYMQRAVEEQHISGNGNFTKKCHALIEELLGVHKVLLTTSCTDALEMAALLLQIQPGDEVIVPAFTFVSTVNAFVLRGARPVFIDVRRDTLNLDETQLERFITSRTKAVVVVHYAGIACEMEKLLEITRRYGLAVVEDNAHGLFGSYKGRYLGTFGCLATQSFHETKNFTCGEGGALLINEAGYHERAEVIWEKGTNRGRFFRGQVDKYSWVDVGSSYLPSDMLAAFLLAQLEARERIQKARARCWNHYHEGLQSWAREGGVIQPTVPKYCTQPFHLYYLIMPSQEERDAIISHLKNSGICAVFHYLPLHLSDMGRRFGGHAGDCPVTEDISGRLFRLPLYNDLTEAEQAWICEAVQRFDGWKSASRRAAPAS
jgi:dTDP-4-amino-4,6-dideoxygalactose transaminase